MMGKIRQPWDIGLNCYQQKHIDTNNIKNKINMKQLSKTFSTTNSLKINKIISGYNQQLKINKVISGFNQQLKNK